MSASPSSAAPPGAKRHLPVFEPRGSLAKDGSRVAIYPADVHGRFTLARRIAFLVLIGVYVATPWIQINGRPAVFLDLPRRHFHLFGATFNAQDFWLVFFLLSGVGFALVYATTLMGRVWCATACPQTVFLEAVYRPIERWIDGPREARIRLDHGPWSFAKVWRRVLKHALFALVSIALAHVFLSYFVSLPSLFSMMRGSPLAHWEAFVWVSAISGVLYFNYAFFREQLCLVICPYGRLQSVMTDDDTLVVGYDARRGEPRGKAKQEGVGDCVDCKRCVAVCPTGIDIRDGLQLDCIGCTQCIDACDKIMDSLHRPRGLVRYDSMNSLAGKGRRLLRPRVFAYTALGAVGLVVATFAAGSRQRVAANILRPRGAPYVLVEGGVRNVYEAHVVNKSSVRTRVHLHAEEPSGIDVVFPRGVITLEPSESQRLPFVVTRRAPSRDRVLHLRLDAKGEDGVETTRQLEAPILGPL